MHKKRGNTDEIYKTCARSGITETVQKFAYFGSDKKDFLIEREREGGEGERER